MERTTQEASWGTCFQPIPLSFKTKEYELKYFFKIQFEFTGFPGFILSLLVDIHSFYIIEAAIQLFKGGRGILMRQMHIKLGVVITEMESNTFVFREQRPQHQTMFKDS